MRVCWDLGPTTARAIHQASQQDRSPLLRLFDPWAYTTTRGILEKLVSKGYLEVVPAIDVMLLGVDPARRRETIDYLERLLGDRDEAVALCVPRGPRVAFTATDPKKASEVAAQLSKLGARVSTEGRERKNRYAPLISREKALEEESTYYLETIYPSDPAALAILEKQIAKLKKKAPKTR